MPQQVTAKELGEPTAIPVPFEMLTGIQRAYVDWKALGGIITDDDGAHRLTLEKLGQMLNSDNPVLPSTLGHSCKNVPNFWDLVTERRKVFNSSSRLAYMHDKWYVAAANMKNWQLTEAWLINHDENYKAPKLKIEHTADDSWLNLVASKKNIIEGEVVDSEN